MNPKVEQTTRTPPSFVRIIACFIVSAVVFQTLTLEYCNSSSITVDEFAHVPAGIAAWDIKAFYLYRENPPLVRSLLALPAWLSGARMDYAKARGGLGRRQEWQVGNDFMRANASRYRVIFWSARCVNIALSTACGLLIFLWAYELGGGSIAVISSLLWFLEAIR